MWQIVIGSQANSAANIRQLIGGSSSIRLMTACRSTIRGHPSLGLSVDRSHSSRNVLNQRLVVRPSQISSPCPCRFVDEPQKR
ncbi:hypothetical protein KIN20_009614 [Parelaphostrongylus tenuis]|uniref:Uncharacterized protein n=1 Tax=Parelaphostrongylus tenuis TaxID=148309 RepID=A0AAD5QNG4_PARTN|nr:hypothetical protein KIN20_009614 [Parelaphostrongylus tenuis]